MGVEAYLIEVEAEAIPYILSIKEEHFAKLCDFISLCADFRNILVDEPELPNEEDIQRKLAELSEMQRSSVREKILAVLNRDDLDHCYLRKVNIFCTIKQDYCGGISLTTGIISPNREEQVISEENPKIGDLEACRAIIKQVAQQKIKEGFSLRYSITTKRLIREIKEEKLRKKKEHKMALIESTQVENGCEVLGSVLDVILSFLNVYDIAHVGSVCKHWNNIVSKFQCIYKDYYLRTWKNVNPKRLKLIETQISSGNSTWKKAVQQQTECDKLLSLMQFTELSKRSREIEYILSKTSHKPSILKMDVINLYSNGSYKFLYTQQQVAELYETIKNMTYEGVIEFCKADEGFKSLSVEYNLDSYSKGTAFFVISFKMFLRNAFEKHSAMILEFVERD